MTRSFISLGLALFAFGVWAQAEPGVSGTEILLGSSCDLSGAVKDVGTGMATGARVYFNKINSQGGVNGRKIRFTPKDDGYDPARALENVKTLVEKDKVFAVIDSNGTPTGQATMPYLIAQNVPSLFAFTGAPILYAQPPVENYFQLRVSYADEAERVVNFAIQKLGIKEIGVFYQDDAFGTVGRASLDKTLAQHGLRVTGAGSYARSSIDVAKAVSELKKANPKAVFMQAVTKPAIEFIKKCLQSGFHPIFMGQSAIGLGELKAMFAQEEIDLYLSEVVPSPFEESLAIEREYRKDMLAAGETAIDYFTMEGYLGAKTFVEALKLMGPDVTRKKLVHTLEKMTNLDLGGLQVSFGPARHVGFRQNFIYHIREGRVRLIPNEPQN